MKITTVLTDIGGVLAGFDDARTVRAFSAMSSFSPELVRSCLFAPSGLAHLLMSGSIDLAIFRTALRRRLVLPKSITDDVLDTAFSDVIVPNQDVIDLLSDLRKSGLTITAVSNADPLRYARFERMGYASIFDHAILSYEEHLCKPSEELMVRALDRSGCAAEEALFIDDVAANLVPAGAIGIPTHHFRHIGTLQVMLEKLGIFPDR